MKIAKRAITVSLLLLIFCTSAQALGTMDYVVDTDGKTQIPIPVTHQIEEVYGYLGPDGGFLTEPNDIFVDSNDNIYIADTGNNRIVKLNPEGEYVRSYTDSDRLGGPEGIYVSDNGDVYIGDTLNQRIVHLDKDDNFIEEFTKPESELLDEGDNFQVGRISITKQGYIYTIKGQYFMAIDAKNEFKGFIGGNNVGFSLKSLLIRMFASDEMKAKLLAVTPASYNSFTIGGDGMTYAVTDETKTSEQIQKLNSLGENIYKSKTFGETYYNKHTMQYNNPRFVDIAVNDENIIYVLEQYSKQIYTYDQEGNILAVFGGEGSIKGQFSLPIALDVNSEGDIFVLDKATGYVHRFEQTEFVKNVITAVMDYEDGDYGAAYESWNRVLSIDANYTIANQGIAKSLYKSGDLEDSMKYYKWADDKGGYGQAFSEYRYQIFRAHFGVIVLIMASIITLLIFTISRLKKRADAMAFDYFLSKGAKKR